MNNLTFSEEADYREAYLIAKIQFKKIIKNFNEAQFKLLFDQLFHDKKNYKLFLKKDNTLLCGALGYIHQDRIFIDIFFWNRLMEEYSMNTVRYFFEKFFNKTSKMGIKSAILPLDLNRKKFKSFKKHNEIFFRSEKMFDLKDEYIKTIYTHHHLLEINYKYYFSQNEKIHIR